MEWGHHWIQVGFQSLEALLEKYSGTYCFGDQVTFADCLLIPQIYNARRFSVDLTAFPNIVRIEKNLEKLEAFQKAHPDQQPDCPKD
mmetsp:Transcript_9699/g.14613  ORF Transcript_9699/g.14613 Transcript_9699/m.14613 type:complete len:87 (-) Transcript_9699:102-362(-)